MECLTGWFPACFEPADRQVERIPPLLTCLWARHFTLERQPSEALSAATVKGRRRRVFIYFCVRKKRVNFPPDGRKKRRLFIHKYHRFFRQNFKNGLEVRRPRPFLKRPRPRGTTASPERAGGGLEGIHVNMKRNGHRMAALTVL